MNKEFNDYYYGLLLNLLSGSEGEVLCELQFFYYEVCLEKFNKDLFKTFEAIEEIFSSNKRNLAKAIIDIGGEVIFSDSKGRFINGRKIDYVKDIKLILNLSYELINKKIIDYKITINKIENIKIKKYLQENLQALMSAKKMIEIIKNQYNL